jgi:nucleoside-diphosphate-sugar epimerase
MRKRALVTGGCGFVGRHMAVGLLERGYAVTVVDDLSTGIHPRMWPMGLARSIEDSPHFEFLESDVRDFVRGADAEFDLIVHLAAVVGGRLVIESSPLLVATDLAIDADLFNWMVQPPRPSKVLYFSSSAAYPIGLQTRDDRTVLDEGLIDFGSAEIGVPDMTYGWSKLTGELLARFAAQKHDLDVVCYRPFSGYGEDQDLSYPFPSIMQRVARRDDPLVVWGSGEQERDFLHIDDVVDAVFSTCDRLAPAEALNLGSGVATSFTELAGLACEIAGHETEIVTDTTKPEGVFSRVADVTRMRTMYTPQVTIDRGIKRMLEHQTEQLEASR